MQIGGNVAKARLLACRGVDGAVAGASVVVDVTLVVMTQVVFSLCGVVLLLGHLGHGRLAGTALAGAAMMALLVAAFFVAQRSGLFGSAMSALERALGTLAGRSYRRDGEALDAEVAALYRRRGALLGASSWHLASWVLGTGEVWLALAFLGHPVGVLDSVLLESLGQALRAAAFAVPGALGVQEGGFLVLGGLLGLAPETCLALSLSKRARELVLGVPGQIAWQAEGASALVAAGEEWTPLKGTGR
jgi:putative membrane protein